MKKKHIHGPNIYDPNCKLCREFGMPVSKTVNRHLLDEDDPTYLTDEQEEELEILERLVERLRKQRRKRLALNHSVKSARETF